MLPVEFQVVLMINHASAAGAGYWHRSAVHTAWLGRGANRLGLPGGELGGQADLELSALRSVLLGRQPGAGPLTARPAARRRQGWDLVFAAPKSVSLLATCDVPAAADVRRAYRQAVVDAFGAIEDNAAWLRSGGRQVRAWGVVAAAFEHVDNNAGQPHIHTHVVLANLATDRSGNWGCLVARELWRWREGTGAGFQLALRSRLNAAGFGFDWELSPGGLGEVSSVPRQAISAASSRSLASRAGARSFGSASAAGAQVARARSRQAAPRQATTAPHQGASPSGQASEGLHGERHSPALTDQQARSILAHAIARPALPSPPPSPGAVATALAARSSTFGEQDVLVALAETSPRGLYLQQALDWSSHWRATSSLTREVPGQRSRTWTTSLASRLDSRVVDLAVEARYAHVAEVSPALAWPELEALGTEGPTAAFGAELACSGHGVSVVAPAPWLAQAGCIDAARAVWQAAGMSVRVSCPSELSARRWRALTSLRDGTGGANGHHGGDEPTGVVGAYGAGWPNRPGRRVLVVDAADHMSPMALAQLVTQATASATKLVLVAGGTAPKAAASLARSFDQLLEELSAPPVPPLVWRQSPAREHEPMRVPGEVPGGVPGRRAQADGFVSVGGLVVRGSFTGVGAATHLVARWHETALAGREPPLMVAYGPAEAEALNLAARAARSGTGPGHAGMDLGERSYALGDEVIALRRIGEVPGATRGTVVAVEARSLIVEWRGTPSASQSTLGQEHARSLGYGYATTLPYLRHRSSEKDLMVLGDPLELGRHSSAVKEAWVTVAGPGMPALGPGGAAARHRAGLGELATNWPDEAMLRRAGPRPLAAADRRRWAEIVTACAVERDLANVLLGAAVGVPGRGRASGPEAAASPERYPAEGTSLELQPARLRRTATHVLGL